MDQISHRSGANVSHKQLVMVFTTMNTERTYIYHPERHAGRLSLFVIKFILPLAFSIHCINISVHSPCNVLTLDSGLTVPEDPVTEKQAYSFVFQLVRSEADPGI